MADPLTLLVGTRKGAFVFRGDKTRKTWKLEGPYYLGNIVNHLVADPRDGRTILMAAKTGHLGPTVFRSQDGGRTWAEGVEGDGIGESISLTVHKPLPLDAIMIMPGFTVDPEPRTKNNRVAEIEITLNEEHTFTAAIPDEEFSDLYPIPIRGYTKPVQSVKLVIKKVHPGTSGDTCISHVDLRARLSKKPSIQGAR